ncbi:S4 domain-containing protein YaaA [Vagococcus silagei]|uniref:S4 domain-containing protein YaaA n=1 Tax=Vagococcus silagei TaxID=2508885 RepID=A0A4S3B5R4_9ENTE|nr:S4 domain-containing protein YaaA [Vagococcus silagei]THB61898.1 S4 domain-containing protein YaaA [Vagococcus silagei]
MKEKFILTAEYITLGQFLKEINVISSGGMAKWFLQENVVYVDGEVENRRGRKLYAEMMIEVPEVGTFFMVSSTDSNRDE